MRAGESTARTSAARSRASRAVTRRVLSRAHLACWARVLLLGALSVRSAAAQGAIVGRVTDAAQRPIPAAEVEATPRGIRSRTDSTGYFRLPGLSPGEYRIRLRRLGFKPGSVDVRLVSNDSLVVHVVLEEIAQPLPEMPVEALAVPARLRGFELRRTSGVGHFLTAKDLTPERSRLMGDVLVRLPGTYMVRSSGSACLTTTRGVQSFTNSATGYCGNLQTGGQYCPVAVFMDGSPLYSGHDSEEQFNLNGIRADEVAAVEFYSGASTIPREFAAPRGTCGVLVIWMK